MLIVVFLYIPVCNGLTCKNGGKLDTKNCVCKCRKHYTGKSCQTCKYYKYNFIGVAFCLNDILNETLSTSVKTMPENHIFFHVMGTLAQLFLISYSLTFAYS